MKRHAFVVTVVYDIDVDTIQACESIKAVLGAIPIHTDSEVAYMVEAKVTPATIKEQD